MINKLKYLCFVVGMGIAVGLCLTWVDLTIQTLPPPQPRDIITLPPNFRWANGEPIRLKVTQIKDKDGKIVKQDLDASIKAMTQALMYYQISKIAAQTPSQSERKN